MERFNTIRVLTVTTALCLTAVAGFASETQETYDYQPDMKPGITYHKVDSQPTNLMDAIRNRQSISITAESTRQATQTTVGAGPKVYRVKPGDTLWDICDTTFSDPYVWPRIWSYNPGITNPHWIYPGDMLRLEPPSTVVSAAGRGADEGSGGAEAGSHMRTGTRDDAILQRNRGFVDQEVLDQSGIIRGAQTERMLLSQYDEAYVEFKKNRDIQVGDEFAAFQVLQSVGSVSDPGTDVGSLVEILGVVRVISFDRNQRVARVVIDESLHPIERGTQVGPVHRRFDLIPSRTNQVELKANVIASLDPTLLFSQHQIVFVDKGHEDGVREGNRFFAIQKRDRFQETNRQADAHDGFPFEVIAELRVLEARPRTATCIVVNAIDALEVGADLEMVKGY